jgi:hypothetical protein
MAFKTGSYVVVPTASDDAYGSALRSGKGTDTGGSDPSTAGPAYWDYPGGPATTVSSGWRYRSLYTHGYMAAGYKGGNAWRCTNKTWLGTDTTVYCGEQLDREGSYLDGNFSDHNGYLQNNGMSGTGTNLSSYSLSNGQTRKITTTGGFSSSGVTYGYVGNDPKNEGLDYGGTGYSGDVGGWNFNSGIGDSAGMAGIKSQRGVFAGGGTTEVNNLHYPTEIMYTVTACPSSGRPATGAHGESSGWAMFSNNVKHAVTFSTHAWHSSGWGGSYGDGHCKCLSTKHGHHYLGSGNNVTTHQHKFSDSNGSTVSTFAKVRSCGEENPMMGQDHGYQMGHYDGQQNNHTVKYVYTNDAQTTMGAACMPKGHYGTSSGCCATGAAQMTNIGVS